MKIWVTEYGFETKPGEPKGVTNAQQAAYAKQAMTVVGQSPYVFMFIWFIFRDDPTSTWQSGLEHEDSARKPAYGDLRCESEDARLPQPDRLRQGEGLEPHRASAGLGADGA